MTPIYLPHGLLERIGEVRVLDETLVTSDAKLTPLGVCAYWALVSLAAFTLMYKLSRYYTPLIFKGYGQMTKYDQRDWDTRLGNILYPIYIVYWAARLIMAEGLFWEPGPVPLMKRTSLDSYAALGVSIGFFIMELAITLKYWMGGSAMVVHHLGSLASVLSASWWGDGHCLTLWMLSTELTTPFIALRFLLDKAGLKSHPVYVVNGIAILISWTVARLLNFVPFFSVVWQHRADIPLLKPVSQVLLVVFPVILAGLNCYWYTKIVRGAIKRYHHGRVVNEAVGLGSTSLRKLELAVKTQQPDAVALRVSDALRTVADLELLQAPGLPFLIPKEYQSLPRLVGRAVVELTVEKRDGSLGFLDPVAGGPARTGRLVLTLDGYSAPLSAGNFLKNVMDGLYNDRPLQVNYTSIFVQGSPTLERPPVPLEILPAGEFEPLYRLPLDVQSGELPVLPLSIPGALAFGRLPSTDSFLSGSDWFIYKFDKQQAGLAGLAFDEGTFGVFGYVTEGMDNVAHLEPGDVITAVRVISGADKLVVPGSGAAPAGSTAVASAAAAATPAIPAATTPAS